MLDKADNVNCPPPNAQSYVLFTVVVFGQLLRRAPWTTPFGLAAYACIAVSVRSMSNAHKHGECTSGAGLGAIVHLCMVSGHAPSALGSEHCCPCPLGSPHGLAQRVVSLGVAPFL